MERTARALTKVPPWNFTAGIEKKSQSVQRTPDRDSSPASPEYKLPLNQPAPLFTLLYFSSGQSGADFVKRIRDHVSAELNSQRQRINALQSYVCYKLHAHRRVLNPGINDEEVAIQRGLHNSAGSCKYSTTAQLPACLPENQSPTVDTVSLLIRAD